MSDNALARKWGVGQSIVSRKRVKLGIPPYQGDNPSFRPLPFMSTFWTSARDRELGLSRDIELAHKWGINRNTVYRRRKLLGIQNHLPKKGQGHLRLTPAQEQELGKLSDASLARKWGVDSTTVGNYRKRRGVTAYQVKPPTNPQLFSQQFWTPTRLAQLGTLHDVDLALRWGIAAGTVRRKRVAQGIGSYQPQRAAMFSRINPGLIKELGTCSDAEIAQKWHRSKERIRKIRNKLGIKPFGYNLPVDVAACWTPENLGQLGQWSDTQLAQKWGIAKTQVRLKRISLGIPSFGRPRNHVQVKKYHDYWTQEKLSLLGTKTDEALAKEWGVASSTVNRQRKQQGIPPYKKGMNTNYQVDPQTREVSLTEEQTRDLGKFTDSFLSKKWRVPYWVIARVRERLGIPRCLDSKKAQIAQEKRAAFWTQEKIDLLGKLPHKELAQKWGVAPSTVSRRTKEYQKPYLCPGTNNISRRKATDFWTPEKLALLGQRSDRELAQAWGVHNGTVRRRRQLLAIPKYVKGRKERALPSGTINVTQKENRRCPEISPNSTTIAVQNPPTS